MAHQYEVETSDGRTFNVPTPHHHDDHDDNSFRRHLLDVLKSTGSGIASAVIVRYMYKGRH